MSQFPDGLTVYRVRQSATHASREVRRAWYGRTWQAEWQDTVWCPRAYTEAGVRRKAARWMQYPIERRIRMARRRQWLRAYVTRRSDPFYRAQRVAS